MAVLPSGVVTRLRSAAVGLAVAAIVATVPGCADDSSDDSGDGAADGAATVTPDSSSSDDAQSSDDDESGGQVEAYPRCEDAAGCFLAGFESCISPGSGNSEGFCTVGCSDAGECETPATGDASPTCEDLSGEGAICYLECTGGTCPDGMACNDQLFATRAVCFWAPA